MIPAAEAQVSELLRARHHIREGTPDDFNVRHPTEIAEAIAASARTMEVLLASVASVSLLVGGVGIMNIMLVSVTERTREIGLRMAVGARARDVLRQFLAEAVVLGIAGGLLGVALGIGGVARDRGSLRMADAGLGGRRRDRRRVLCRDRDLLRLLPRPPRFPPRSDRSVAPRVRPRPTRNQGPHGSHG